MKLKFKDGTIIEVTDTKGKSKEEVVAEAKQVYKDFKDSQKSVKDSKKSTMIIDEKIKTKDGLEFFTSAADIVDICKAVIYECENGKYEFDILEGEDLEGWKGYAKQGVTIPGHFISLETGKWTMPQNEEKGTPIAFVVVVVTPSPGGTFDTVEQAVEELRNRLSIVKVEVQDNQKVEVKDNEISNLLNQLYKNDYERADYEGCRKEQELEENWTDSPQEEIALSEKFLNYLSSTLNENTKILQLIDEMANFENICFSLYVSGAGVDNFINRVSSILNEKCPNKINILNEEFTPEEISDLAYERRQNEKKLSSFTWKDSKKVKDFKDSRKQEVKDSKK